MYDAVDDPYTYENSTVLINRLNLRDQANSTISKPRFPAPAQMSRYQKEIWISRTTARFIVTSSKMYTNGPERHGRCASQSKAIRSVSPSISVAKPPGFSLI
jgi:hypothetical protein